ncbi:unnamed protein product, partial [Urochloa humidicola]
TRASADTCAAGAHPPGRIGTSAPAARWAPQRRPRSLQLAQELAPFLSRVYASPSSLLSLHTHSARAESALSLSLRFLFSLVPKAPWSGRMPAWWKGKGRSGKSSKAAAAAAVDGAAVPAAAAAGEIKGKKKASSFDEALLAAGARGKHQHQQPAAAAAAAAVVGLPLPRPASLPAPPPSAPTSASASASSGGGGGSSLGSSAASDEQLDLGVYRLSETNSTLPGRTTVESQKQSHMFAEGRIFTNNQTLEHPRLSETSVSPRKEFHLQNLDLANDRTTYCRGRKSTEIVFSTQVPSSPPSSRGYHYPTSPVLSRTFGQSQTSPTGRQDDSRSSSSPQPLPLPPGSPCLPSRSLQWKKGKLLGSGTFGQVYLGFNSEGGQMCAIKEVKVISDDSNSKRVPQAAKSGNCAAESAVTSKHCAVLWQRSV